MRNEDALVACKQCQQFHNDDQDHSKLCPDNIEPSQCPQWPIINLTVNDSALFISPRPAPLPPPDNPLVLWTMLRTVATAARSSRHNHNYWCNYSHLMYWTHQHCPETELAVKKSKFRIKYFIFLVTILMFLLLTYMCWMNTSESKSHRSKQDM